LQTAQFRPEIGQIGTLPALIPHFFLSDWADSLLAQDLKCTKTQ